MNAGAAAARSNVLLFLHADTRLPFGWADQVAGVLGSQGVVAGAFRLAFDAVSPGLRFIEHAANLRSVLLGKPYGDQAVFLPRAIFQQVGGFRDLPIMEDYDLICRLRRVGRVRIAPLAAITSARRWRDAGIVRTTLAHQAMIAGWHIGVSPRRLARWRSTPRIDKQARRTMPDESGPALQSGSSFGLSGTGRYHRGTAESTGGGTRASQGHGTALCQSSFPHDPPPADHDKSRIDDPTTAG
jgi:hypothetical protein